ncbi:hypothetical protein [uncultured Microbacterium sp.]|uniref:hypothetical protein n=1 Tax=uncultured Microbacterium sp. TaxID=191216 RepID=UPI00262F5311|nr:hypothetical protein [uncultured Microbacterium sp.]
MLDRLDRGMSTEFDGPVGHDGWPDARPEWEDIDHDEHRQECLDNCSTCDGFRAWGLCPACGNGDAETDDAGDSTCCKARVLFGDEADRAWNA